MSLTNDERVRLADQLATLGRDARRQQRATHLLLVLLLLTAAGAAVVGIVADSNVIWGIAGGAVSAACVALIAYAGTRLGVFGQMVNLVRLNLATALHPRTEDQGASAEEDLRLRVMEAMAHIRPDEGDEENDERSARRRRRQPSKAKRQIESDQDPEPGPDRP